MELEQDGGCVLRLTYLGLKDVCRDGDLVKTHGEIRQTVGARFRRSDGTRCVCGRAHSGDLSARNGCTALIRHRSGDVARGNLRKYGDRSEKKEEKSTAYEYTNTL